MARLADWEAMKLGETTKYLAIAAAAATLLAACGSSSEEQSLSQKELAATLTEDGYSDEAATCAAGLEIADAKTRSKQDSESSTLSERLDAFADTCAENELALDELDAERAELAFVDQEEIDAVDTLGDDEALDALWVECEEGIGASCDELFSKSPLGSDYEDYGLSCGRRPEVLYCSELDAEDGLQPVPEIAAVAVAEEEQSEAQDDLDAQAAADAADEKPVVEN